MLYPGRQHSLGCLQPLVELSEGLLCPKPHQRPKIVWRLDGGFGSDDALKWLLARHYQLLGKGYSSSRARKVGRAVADDQWQAVRHNKWVAPVPTQVRYGRSVRTLALHWITEQGRQRYAMLLHTLLEKTIPQVLKLYDARGGTIESDLHQDKLGLQLIRRRKQQWSAQEAWIILTDIAHNLLVWSHDCMLSGSSFESYGMLRLIEDVLSIPGCLEFKGGILRKVSLQRTHPLAPETLSCLERLFKELCH